MYLLAESGSTKCDWICLDSDGVEANRFYTMGFNPFFHSAEFIQEELSNDLKINEIIGKVEQIYFYGAGCSSDELKAIIKDGLQRVFPDAMISVDHDLVAAAYSTYSGKPEIACILGTGSNSCYFDGENVREEVPALAYILGDEGSASYLGKKLIAAFLYRKLPEELHAAFVEKYNLTKADIFNRVYNQPHANVYLAGFGRFVGKHSEHPYLRNLVKQGFEEFIDTHVLCFPEAPDCEINFVGSVAYHFQGLLSEVLSSKGLTLGNVVGKPVDGLVSYHLNFMKILENPLEQ
ncbi:MAG: ATPase [Schleiferiaceae bacterium]